MTRLLPAIITAATLAKIALASDTSVLTGNNYVLPCSPHYAGDTLTNVFASTMANLTFLSNSALYYQSTANMTQVRRIYNNNCSIQIDNDDFFTIQNTFVPACLGAVANNTADSNESEGDGSESVDVMDTNNPSNSALAVSVTLNQTLGAQTFTCDAAGNDTYANATVSVSVGDLEEDGVTCPVLLTAISTAPTFAITLISSFSYETTNGTCGDLGQSFIDSLMADVNSIFAAVAQNQPVLACNPRMANNNLFWANQAANDTAISATFLNNTLAHSDAVGGLSPRRVTAIGRLICNFVQAHLSTVSKVIRYASMAFSMFTFFGSLAGGLSSTVATVMNQVSTINATLSDYIDAHPEFAYIESECPMILP